LAVDLSKLHPDLRLALDKLLAAMNALGFPMKVVQGLRSASEQQALYAEGRTAPGHVVTNADGVTHKSNHQPHLDGFGHAADLAFVVNGTVSWDPHLPWSAYGACAKALGLVWGGDWHSIVDLPHVELPDVRVSQPLNA
jgi:peptidoglycan L-alanyl-D-glutamate endopeptidase CwlK